MKYSPPVLGAALKIPYLEKYREWMLQKPRDLELQDFYFPHILDGDWQSPVDQARKLLDGLEGRIGIHGPFVGLSVGFSDPLLQDVIIKRLDQGLEICRALGATFMVIHSPVTYWSHYNMPARKNGWENLIENCHVTMSGAVKKAEDIGCILMIENIEDINPDLRRELANSFNSPAVQVSLDTGHAHFAHHTFGAPPVDYFIRSAGNRLGHVHLQDVDGYADRHWAPGEGTIPWDEVFRAIGELNCNPRLVLELVDMEKIPAAAAWLEAKGLVQ